MREVSDFPGTGISSAGKCVTVRIRISRISRAERSGLFGWLLAALDTPNLGFSILSVATSFLAAALTMLRSSYYGLGYAANDIVLVVLWVLASCEDPAYIPVAVNFGIFLFHDFYGLLSWKKRERHMAQTA